MNDSNQNRSERRLRTPTHKPSATREARPRSMPLALLLSTTAVVCVAVGVGAGIYRHELAGLFGTYAGSGPVNAQEATAEPSYSETNNTADQPSSDEAESLAGGTTTTSGRLGQNPFIQHADEAGISSCSSLYAALGDSLTGGASYGVQSFWDQTAPDAHAIQGIVGLTYEGEDYAGPAAGYVFAAPNAGACEGAMVRVAPYQIACSEIPTLLPEGSERMNDLGAVAAYRLEDGGQALLLPVGETCAVISVVSGVRNTVQTEGEAQ